MVSEPKIDLSEIEIEEDAEFAIKNHNFIELKDEELYIKSVMECLKQNKNM